MYTEQFRQDLLKALEERKSIFATVSNIIAGKERPTDDEFGQYIINRQLTEGMVGRIKSGTAKDSADWATPAGVIRNELKEKIEISTAILQMPLSLTEEETILGRLNSPFAAKTKSAKTAWVSPIDGEGLSAWIERSFIESGRDHTVKDKPFKDNWLKIIENGKVIIKAKNPLPSSVLIKSADSADIPEDNDDPEIF
jgi:hypothetical protein